MLNHFVVGPHQGRYLVAYLTPGCAIPTTVEDCPSEPVALAESSRLNALQIEREEAIRADALARKLYHVYPDLEGK